jgi:hypothetical protein
MADEKYCDARPRETPNLFEQSRDLVCREGRRRLVHDENANVERDGLGDLHRLLLGYRQTPRRGSHIETHVESREDRVGLTVHLAPSDEGPSITMTYEDVLGYVQIREDRRLLIDGSETMPLGVGRAQQGDLLAVDNYSPGVGRVDSRHYLDQRGLTCSVLADEGLDLARVEGEGDTVECLRRVKPLGDSRQLQDRRGLRHAAHDGCPMVVIRARASCEESRREYWTVTSASLRTRIANGTPFGSSMPPRATGSSVRM